MQPRVMHGYSDRVKLVSSEVRTQCCRNDVVRGRILSVGRGGKVGCRGDGGGQAPSVLTPHSRVPPGPPCAIVVRGRIWSVAHGGVEVN